MESQKHRILKDLAIAFLHANGCAVIGTEVRCPIARYRVDVAGYADRPWPPDSATNPRNSRKVPPRTIMIECKQSRADFLTHTREVEKLFKKRKAIEHRIERVEDKLRERQPHLRRSDGFLFREFESWDFDRADDSGYRRLVQQLRRIDHQLYGETKFCMIARYRLADRLYLIAPQGMIKRSELPVSWGLLEVPRAWLATNTSVDHAAQTLPVRVRVRADQLNPRETHQLRLLRNTAAAATREALSLRQRATLDPAREQYSLW